MPLTPFIEEELKKKEDQNKINPLQAQKEKSLSGPYLDTFNMKVIEAELISNQPSAEKLKMQEFPMQLIVKRVNPENHRVSVGLDFTFNALRNVKRVAWKNDAPWFREITDGMSWFAYCKNS